MNRKQKTILTLRYYMNLFTRSTRSLIFFLLHTSVNIYRLLCKFWQCFRWRHHNVEKNSVTSYAIVSLKLCEMNKV